MTTKRSAGSRSRSRKKPASNSETAINFRARDKSGRSIVQCSPRSALRKRDTSPPLWKDRKSTRLNSSHQIISYAVFSLKKKNNTRPLHVAHRAFAAALERAALTQSAAASRLPTGDPPQHSSLSRFLRSPFSHLLALAGP